MHPLIELEPTFIETWHLRLCNMRIAGYKRTIYYIKSLVFFLLVSLWLLTQHTTSHRREARAAYYEHTVYRRGFLTESNIIMVLSVSL